MTIGAGAPLLPQTVAGRYTILDSVGRGAIAEVVRARDERTGEVVALKVLYPHLRESAIVVERFRREVDIVRRIAHPHVLAIREVADGDGLLFLVMDYHPGGDLADRLSRRGRLEADALRTLAAQLCGALAAAHRAGVVHRDVKPSNVLCGPGDELDTRLCDFGLARTGELAGLTTANAVLGTPEYMAPEIITDGHADPRSDIYSLGVVLFEAATGRLPFYGDSPYQLMRQHVDVEAPRASTLAPELPRALDEAIARALAKDPLARFATAEDLARAVATGAHAPAPALVARPATRHPCPACGGWLVEEAGVCADCGAALLRIVPERPGVNVLVTGPGKVANKLDARTHVALYALFDELPPGSARMPRRRRAPRFPFYVAKGITPASAVALISRLQAIGLEASTDDSSKERRGQLRQKVHSLSFRYLAGFGAAMQLLPHLGLRSFFTQLLCVGMAGIGVATWATTTVRSYRPLLRPAPRPPLPDTNLALAASLPRLRRRPDRRLLAHLLDRLGQERRTGRAALVEPLAARAALLADALAKLEARRDQDASVSRDPGEAQSELRREERLGVALRAELLRVASRCDDLALVTARAAADGARAALEPIVGQVDELSIEVDADAEVAALLAARA